MAVLWSLLFSFCANLPWVAIALMAALGLHKQKDNLGLLMQALGATGLFVLGMASWMINWLLSVSGASVSLRNATTTIFSFLLFLALATFALGYCLQRFKRRGNQPIQVTATAVDK